MPSVSRAGDIGDQHQGAHDVLHRFGQVARWLQGLDHGQQGIGVFQVVGVEVHEQQRQRLDQCRVGQRHQVGEMLHGGGKAGHPGQNRLGGVGAVVCVRVCF
jgi:hypothetical protein